VNKDILWFKGGSSKVWTVDGLGKTLCFARKTLYWLVRASIITFFSRLGGVHIDTENGHVGERLLSESERDYAASVSHLARLQLMVREKNYFSQPSPSSLSARSQRFALPSLPFSIPCSTPSLSAPNRHALPPNCFPARQIGCLRAKSNDLSLNSSPIDLSPKP